jgi:carbohydrate kinase (thermoresistant glucokinase family)
MGKTRRFEGSAQMIVLVMGVTGAGKTTVGQGLAERLGWEFIEADDFHSPGNKAKMHRGEPLTDADRIPWLDAIHAAMQAQAAAGKNVVVGCSALKRSYRQRLTADLDVKVVYLKGSQELIASRLRVRAGHFAGESILADQFAVLEEPSDADVVVDVAEPPERIIEEILAQIAATPELSDDAVKQLQMRLRWRLLPFLFLLYVVAYLDRINVGFAALQMKDQLGFSDAVYGFGAGIFFVGYFLFQVPSNMVLERVGARRWIGTLMVFWGFISAGMFLVHSAGSFYTLRFLLGATEAGFFPGVVFYLRGWFPPAVPAGVIALFMTAGPISGVVGCWRPDFRVASRLGPPWRVGGLAMDVSDGRHSGDFARDCCLVLPCGSTGAGALVEREGKKLDPSEARSREDPSSHAQTKRQ